MKILLGFQQPKPGEDTALTHAVMDRIEAALRSHRDENGEPFEVLRVAAIDYWQIATGLSGEETTQYVDPQLEGCRLVIWVQEIDMSGGEDVPWPVRWALDHEQTLMVAHSDRVGHKSLVNMADWTLVWNSVDVLAADLESDDFRLGLELIVNDMVPPPSAA